MSSGASSGQAWRDFSRKVEDLGYSTLVVRDHLDDQWGTLVAISAAAEATERLRVGSLVFDNDFRHPVVLAKEAATLDLVSDGRFEFGIGAGWMKADYDASGIPYDRPGVRVERLAEALGVMKALWADGRCTFAGRHYTVTGAEGAPVPRTRPHPPLLVGGGGREVLGLAAREADIVGFNTSLRAGRIGAEAAVGALPERFRERVTWVRDAAGDRFERLELQCHTFLTQIVPDRRELARVLAPAFGLSPEQALEVPLVVMGTVEEVCDDLVRRREEYGFSYWTIQDEADAFAPVVARLADS
jgi:probable F420-dependent oxidoreductase